jgi:hypothetical protein
MDQLIGLGYTYFLQVRMLSLLVLIHYSVLYIWTSLSGTQIKPPWLGRPLWNICVTNDHEYVLLVVLSSFMIITGFVTRLTRWVPIVEQNLPTLPENLSSPPVLCVVRVTRSLVWCVCFVNLCLSLCAFSFCNCVVCSSSIYGFWLSLWYLQTILTLM